MPDQFLTDAEDDQMKFTSLSSHMVLGIVSCLAVFFLAAALPHAAFAQVDARLLGTWKLNLAKSTFDPGPPVKTWTVTREQVGDAVKYTIEYEDANGIHTTIVETPKFDGKDYPRTVQQYPRAGAPLPDTIALKRIDADTVEETLKKSGKVIQTARQVISKDGTGITTTVTGTDVSGQPVHVVLVYDKQ
jgi:hypothetical protein